jgi:hypothetical protein
MDLKLIQLLAGDFAEMGVASEGKDSGSLPCLKIGFSRIQQNAGPES